MSMAHWTVPCCGPKGPVLSAALRERAIQPAGPMQVPHLLCTTATDCSACFIQRASCWEPSTGDHFRGEDDWFGCSGFPCIRKGQPKTGKVHVMGADQQIGSCGE